MTWLTWRQFRVPAASVLAGMVLIGVVLAVTGPQMVGRTDFSDEDTLFVLVTLMMFVLPAVLGVFWGVPMITRELEAGTHSLIWNQTVTRRRWFTTKLAVGVLAAMLAAGLMSLAVSWWASPIDTMADQQTSRSMLSSMEAPVFGARGIVPVGYAAFAFVLGLAVGMVVRRTVAAMAITLVVFAAVIFTVPFLVRPYYLPPLEETSPIKGTGIIGIHGTNMGVIEEILTREPPGALVLTNETIDPAGNVVSPLPAFFQECMPGFDEGPPTPRQTDACMNELGQRGYQQHLVFQPRYRFWPMQWIEFGLFTVLSALLTWFCFRRLRHLS